MSRADIKAGSAYVELLLRDNQFVRGLNRASQRLKSFGTSMATIGGAITAAGAAITGPFLVAVKQFADFGSVLDDMSARTGVAVESLSELQYAAEQSGTSLQDVEKAIRAMQKKGMAAARFDEIAASIAAIEDPSERAKAAMEKFGKSGAALLPMLKDLPALRREARELGLVMSGEAAASAARLGDSFDRLWSIVGAARNAIGQALTPTVQGVVDQVTGVLGAVRAWIASNEELFASVFKIGAVVTAAGAAFTAIGLSLFTAGVALAGFTSAMAVASTAIGALVSPIGLTITALGGLAYWFSTATEWGRSMVASLAGWFKDLWRIAKDTFGGIADALAAGDLALAGKVAMAGLQVAWLQGTNWLRNKWTEFKDFFLRTTAEVVFEAQRLWTRLYQKLRDLWTYLVEHARYTGEQIGHWLTRSDDPELAADQDRAHSEAMQRIQGEAEARRRQIAIEKQAELAAIEAASQTATSTRNAAFNQEMEARQRELAAAKKDLAGLRQSAAQSRLDAELRRGDAPQFKMGEFDFSPAKARQQIFGSYSAAALQAQGAGMATDPIVKAIDRQNREEARRHRELVAAVHDAGVLQ